MPTRPRPPAHLNERLDQVIQRGYRIRRRRKTIPLGAAALATVATLIAIGAHSTSQTTRVHTIEPVNTSTTTISADPSGTLPTYNAAGSPTSSGATNGPATTPGGNQPSAKVPPTPGTAAPTRGASSQASPTSPGMAYTYVQVCSQPSVGPFGGPTAPPYCWTPSTLNIHVGWTVTFDGTRAFGGTATYHTVTSSSPNWNVDAKVYSNPSFGPGQFAYTFTNPGTYTFYDKNAGGTGTINVSP